MTIECQTVRLRGNRGALTDASLRIAQEKLYGLMMAISDDDEPVDPKLLSTGP